MTDDRRDGLLAAARAALIDGNPVHGERLVRRALASGEAGDAWHVAALIMLSRGDAAASVRRLLRSLAHGVTADRLADIALPLIHLGRLEAATWMLRQAIAAAPLHPTAHLVLARAYHASGGAGSQSHGRIAAAIEPAQPAAWSTLGDAAAARAEGLAYRRRAIALSPAGVEAETHAAMAVALYEAGDRPGATRALRRAHAIFADSPLLLGNLGAMQMRQGEPMPALASLSRAIAIDPRASLPRSNRVTALRAVGRVREAVREGRRGLALAPDAAALLNNLAGAHMLQARHGEAARLFHRALAVDPADAEVRSNLLFLMCFDERVGPDELLRAHRAYEMHHAAASVRPVHRNIRDSERRLVIGYLSPDFRLHPGGHFLLPPIEHHDRERHRVICYHLHPVEDAITHRFRAAASTWRACHELDNQALANLIRADGVDILIECAGHMSGNRLPAVALKPAPIIVSFPLYPATTGLSAIDYRLGDPYFTPPSTDRLHTERLLRLPDAHVCYAEGPWPVTPAARPPSVGRGRIALGCFNNFAKIGDSAVGLWSDILKRLPTAVLVLKWTGLGDTDPDWAYARFVERGIDRSQLALSGYTPDPYTPYLEIDIALDPLHANGGTTTCDALWMGVPVVTCPGDTPFARVGLCHLTNVGLPELIATDPADYVDIVVGLATDPERLWRVRSGLRQRFAASPIMDGRRYTANLEIALRQAWHRWCEGP